MNECIAGLMCGGVREGPGGPVQKVVATGGWKAVAHSIVEVYNVISKTWTRGMSNYIYREIFWFRDRLGALLAT